MKRLVTAALLLAFAGAPSFARAAALTDQPAARAAVGEASRKPRSPTPANAAPGDTADYAAREAAAPGLGNFQGGSAVVFVGGGTVLVILIIVLIILVL